MLFCNISCYKPLVLELLAMFFLFMIAGFSIKIVHPLLLGAGLLFILVGVSGFLIRYGSLFSFCLFIVVVGGVLVVFSYRISLVPTILGSKEYIIEKFGVSVRGLLLRWSWLVSGAFLVFTFYGFRSLCSSSHFETGYFSQSIYFTTDWSIVIFWLGVLLFAVIVMCVSVAGKYDGALISEKKI